MTGSTLRDRFPVSVRQFLDGALGTAWIALAAAIAVFSSDRLDRWLGEGSGEVRFLVACVVLGSAMAVYQHELRRRRRRESVELRLQLERDLCQAKDQFISNVSHGLRTPLTGIVGFAHVLKESVPRLEDAKHADFILAESAELGRMVDDLLTSARLDANTIDIEPEDVWFGEQVDEVSEFMNLLGARILVDYQDVRIRIDPHMFRQILRNLLVNAHRHGKSEVSINGHIRGDRYICAVIDNGPGVSSEVQKRLFTRFAFRAGGGITGYMGLGLSVVGRLCKRMNCDISYRRSRGETHFVVSIPLAAQYREAGNRPPHRVTTLPEPLISVGSRFDLGA